MGCFSGHDANGTSLAVLYHEKYDMKWGPPFLSNCLQAAGYVYSVYGAWLSANYVIDGIWQNTLRRDMYAVSQFI